MQEKWTSGSPQATLSERIDVACELKSRQAARTVSREAPFGCSCEVSVNDRLAAGISG
jgi:hypothetical protein